MTQTSLEDRDGDDRSIAAVVSAYLLDNEAGGRADRSEYLARFPELAAELRAFFAEYDAFDRLAAPHREANPAPGAAGAGAGPEGSRGLRDFEMGEVLGSGGMGVVYQARQRSMNRPVALKMIHGGEWASLADVQRFRNEVEAIAGLAHPHIVPIFEVGEGLGHHYYSMPLMHGGSLAGRLDAFRGDPKAAARMMIQIAGAVDYAHRRGIIHRDLKPSNILLDDAGRPHVSDFGLARRIGEESSLTAPGAIVGSPPYMAPEQAAGRSREVTTATDVYGLGAILYALLAGRPPFRGPTPLEVLEQVRLLEPRPPRAIDRRVDRDLETICLKCLEKEPGRRYASAAALADDLGRWLGGRPVQARRIGPARRLAKWSRRRPLAALLAASLAVGGPAAFAATYAAYRESDRLRVASDLRLYESKVALAELELSSGHADRAEELLEECPPSLRGWGWNHLKRRRLGDPVLVTDRRNTPSSVAFSPDGRLLASGHGDGSVRVSDASTGRELRRLETGGPPAVRLAFAPDGRRLAGSGIGGLLRAWDALEGRPLWTRPGRLGFWSVAYSPDGRQVAAAGFDGSIRLLDAETGEELRSLPGHADRATGVSYRPDGRALASSGDDGTIRIWDPSTGALIRAIPEGGRFPFRDLAYAADGSLIFAATSVGAVAAWDPATGREVFRRDRHIREVWDVSASPDGRLFASAGRDGTVRVWDARGGREVIVLRGHGPEVWGVAFSPDGLKVASAGQDGSIRVWDGRPWDDPDDPARARVFAKAGGRVEAVDFGPDGSLVASAGQDRSVTIWDVASGRAARTLPGPEGGLTCVAFDPSGRTVAAAGYDRTIHLMDAARGGEVRTLPGHSRTALCLAYQPGGRLLASGGEDREVKLWDLDDGREVASHRLEFGWVTGLAFRPDGGQLAAASLGQVAILDPAPDPAAPPRLVPIAMKRVNALAYSPDGRRLAAAGLSSEIFILDASDWTLVRRIAGDDSEVHDLKYAPDGRHLASIGSNHRVDFWDAADGRLVHSLRECVAPPNRLAFSRDGTHLAATGGDRSLRVWDLRQHLAAAPSPPRSPAEGAGAPVRPPRP